MLEFSYIFYKLEENFMKRILPFFVCVAITFLVFACSSANATPLPSLSTAFAERQEKSILSPFQESRPTPTAILSTAPPLSQTAEQNTPQAQMVWISKTGTKYHLDPHCSNMKNPGYVSIESARKMYREPCKKCVGDQSA